MRDFKKHIENLLTPKKFSKEELQKLALYKRNILNTRVSHIWKK